MDDVKRDLVARSLTACNGTGQFGLGMRAWNVSRAAKVALFGFVLEILERSLTINYGVK